MDQALNIGTYNIILTPLLAQPKVHVQPHVQPHVYLKYSAPQGSAHVWYVRTSGLQLSVPHPTSFQSVRPFFRLSCPKARSKRENYRLGPNTVSKFPAPSSEVI